MTLGALNQLTARVCWLPPVAQADSAEQPSDSFPRDRKGSSHRPGFKRPLHGAGYQDSPSLR